MNDARCAVCGGAEEEHTNSRHGFTTTPGELVTKEQQAKAKLQQNKGQIIQLPNVVHPTQVDRLVNILVDKGVIDSHEALFILTGRPIWEGESV